MTTGVPENDAALMRAFASRDQGAADTSLRTVRIQDLRLGIVMLGSDAAAQDLVQDTFVKLWRNADRYDTTRGKLETWVLLVARSLAIDSLRRRVLEARSLEATGHHARTTQPPDPRSWPRPATWPSGPEASHGRGSGREQRAALELAYFGGKTSAEVAELEGIPVGTAKTRIRTALSVSRGRWRRSIRDDM